MIASGKADFAISAQENVTLARVEGIPVVSIGAIIQHNTSAFASLKKDNMTSPKDFEGTLRWLGRTSGRSDIKDNYG